MVYIAANERLSSQTWCLGQILSGAIQDVSYIQANGDELEYIKASFENLAYPKTKVVRWYGDTAKQIVAFLAY